MSEAQAVRVLFRQAVRWSTAAMQDREPLIAVLHANYGAAYIFALRQIASDEAIRRVTGRDARAVEARIVAVQDQATARLRAACAAASPPTPVDAW